MSKYNNPGYVDVEDVERTILASGGGKTIQHKDGYDHVVVYLKDNNWHLSYDLYPDGHIERVHTDKDNHGNVTYKDLY